MLVTAEPPDLVLVVAELLDLFHSMESHSMSLEYPSPPLGLVIPQVSQLEQLDILIAAKWNGSLWLLFNGSHTPSVGDTTYTLLTAAVTWPGIANPTAESFGSASIGADSVAVSYGPQLGWTFNAAAGPVTVGGAFGLAADGSLLGEELIPTGPVTLEVTGQVLPYQPIVSLGPTQYCSSDTI